MSPSKPIVTELDRALELAARGALFVVNDSGGKDSQAQRLRLLAAGIPASQMVVVHATLGEIEWPGALEQARDGALRCGLPFIVAKARKTFLELVEHRAKTYPTAPAFPQAGNRQCTSDLKRDPIVREVRRYAKTRGIKIIVTCLGLRAEESPGRAKRETFSKSRRYSTGGREWFEWLPVHHLTTAEVFATIATAGEVPHPAYAAGNDRLSCMFCIMASRGDLRRGAISNPDLYARYVELEERTGYTLHQSRKTLPELTGLSVEDARAARRSLPVIRALPTGKVAR